MIELSVAATGAGGKAAGLARLIGAGLPVPAGFAITGAAFRAVTGAGTASPLLDELGSTLAGWALAAGEQPLPAALEAEVSGRARALGGPLIVRSSMSIEDGATRAAPGLGRSIAGVEPADVWAAVRCVWVASVTPLVALYARSNRDETVAAPGVVVQRQVAGTRMTVFTRPPGRPRADEVWLDAGDGPPRRAGRAEPDAAIALALAAEAAIAAPAGADIELVRGHDGSWSVVQARPLLHPPPRPPRVAPPPFVLAPLRSPPRAWRRDVSHNPDPLSTAQAGLCELVERSGAAPFHLAVVAGFLYTAERSGDSAPPRPGSAAELEARFAVAAAEVEQVLASADGTLTAALPAYVAAYRVIALELGPMIAAARTVLVDRLVADGAPPRVAATRAAALAPRRPSSLVAAVAATARGELDRAGLIALAGDLAPVWDVASPSFAEHPARFDDAIALAGARPALPPEPAPPPELAAEVALARAAADAAERDDLLFARAQAVVRRALLGAAHRLGLVADDVFWLPLDEVSVADPADEAWRSRAPGRAAAARAAAARSAGWAMPITLDDQPNDGFGARLRSDAKARQTVGPAAGPGQVWNGAGVGGRVAGPAARFDHLGDAVRVRRGAIVVVRAVTPALALLVEGAAAIVCEHGSLLDHGAAMARELGIPCVVGCAGVVDSVIDGEWLDVDGDAGRVARLD